MNFYFRDARTEEDEVEANIEEVDRIFEIIVNINKRGKPVTVKKFYTDSIQLPFSIFFSTSTWYVDLRKSVFGSLENFRDLPLCEFRDHT